MTDRDDAFEREVTEWLEDRGRTTASDVRYAADGIAHLPPRDPSRRRSLLTAAAAIVVVAGVGALLLGRISLPGVSTRPALPDPAAFAGDPRLAVCPATGALTIFEMAHVGDFYAVFPHADPMFGFPEDLDVPALVVVYAGPPSGGRPPAYDPPTPPPSFGPNLHGVCIVAGRHPSDWAPIGIVSVDMTDLDPVATAAPLDPAPSRTTTRPAATDPTEPSGELAPSFSPEPAPAWAADLAGQLDCVGDMVGLGGEIPDNGSAETYGATPDDALATFLGPSNPYATLPASGFEPLHLEPHWAEFGYAVDGRTKTVVVLSDTTIYGTGWAVMGLRSCDASEFDPSTPLTFPVTIWTDTAGQRVSTDAIRSHPGPAHCGHESATWLYVGRQLFFRDPKHVMADWSSTTYDADAALPKRAVDSGYRSGDTQLWIDPKGDAYLVGPDRTERWPRSTDPDIGCA